MLVPNRHGSSNSYRYGFQGQEKDDELKGEGNSLNYTFRMHDPRVGRFFVADPLASQYAFYSPYQFAGNKLINAIEFEGLEPVFVHGTFSDKTTWPKEFKERMSNILGYKLDESIDDINWGGGNSVSARKKAADKIVKELTNIKTNPLAHEKHAILIGHSHGGNVNKLVKKKLLAMGWRVDMINIETPQRSDYKAPIVKGKGINISFYSEFDLIQFGGSFSLRMESLPEFNYNYFSKTTGREDPNAINYKLEFKNPYLNGKSWYEKPFIEFGYTLERRIPDWFSSSLGHSLNTVPNFQNQIYEITKRVLGNTRKKEKEKEVSSSPRYF